MKIISLEQDKEILEANYTTTFNSGGKLYLGLISLSDYKLKISKALGSEKINPNQLKKVNDLHSKGRRLDIEITRNIGLVRASEELKETEGRGYSLNGGFYLDTSALDGVTFSKSPSLYYGDPVDWIRVNWRDFGIPYYNRSVLKILSDNSIKIDRNPLKGMKFSINGVIYNIERKGAKMPTLFNSMEGLCAQNHMYITVSGNTIIECTNKASLLTQSPNYKHLKIENSNNKITQAIVGTKIKILDEDESKYVKTMSPILIKDYEYTTNKIWEIEGYTDNTHPLTLTRDIFKYRAARSGLFFTRYKGEIIFGVSENNVSGYGEGLTLKEFAELVSATLDIKGIRIKEGYYLDGGSSSVMCKSKGRGNVTLINTPSGISNPNVEGYERGEEPYIGSVILAIKNG